MTVEEMFNNVIRKFGFEDARTVYFAGQIEQYLDKKIDESIVEIDYIFTMSEEEEEEE